MRLYKKKLSVIFAVLLLCGCGLFDSDKKDKDKDDGDEMLQYTVTTIAKVPVDQISGGYLNYDFPNTIEIKKNSIGKKPEGRINLNKSGWLEMINITGYSDLVYIDLVDTLGIEFMYCKFDAFKGDSLNGKFRYVGKLIDGVWREFTAKY